jgi:hypothetical protein
MTDRNGTPLHSGDAVLVGGNANPADDSPGVVIRRIAPGHFLIQPDPVRKLLPPERLLDELAAIPPWRAAHVEQVYSTVSDEVASDQLEGPFEVFGDRLLRVLPAEPGL